jgi:type I restriction enzyme S subunit
LPKGWEYKPLGALLEETRDAAMPSDVQQDTRYVGLEHIPRRTTTLNDFGVASDVTSLKFRFERGDILFGKIRPYFHKVVWAGFSGICSSDALVLRPLNEDTAGIAVCVTSSEAFVAHAVQTSNGTKMPRANWAVLKQYPVPIPPPELLGRFNSFVMRSLESAATLQACNERLAQSRDLLLRQLIPSIESEAPAVGLAAGENIIELLAAG